MDSQSIESQATAPKPQLKTRTKASQPKATQEAPRQAVVDEPPKELVLKARLRSPEQIALYQKLLEESGLNQNQFIVDRCLNTGDIDSTIPLINIQAYHELGQCRLVFEGLIEQLNAIAGSDSEPLASLIDQLQQELTAIRTTRKAVVNIE